MAGISINILSNVRGAVKGVDDVADALDDAHDALRDLTKEGDTSTDRLTDDFRKVQRSTDKTADDIKGKIRDAYRAAARSSDNAADDIVRSQRRMGEQSAEVGQEIRQNLGEGIANAARGDFEGLADVIGDTLGGAVAGIGGIGTAALGVAGALGIGAIVAAFSLADEARQKLQDRASDLASAYIDAGSNVLDAMTIASRASEFLSDPEKREETEKLSEVLGVSMSEAARALAGDMNALNAANEIVKSGEEERLELMRESANYLSGDFTKAEKDRLDRLLAQDAAVRGLNEVNGMANQTFQDQQAVLFDLINTAEGVTKEVDEVGNAVYNLPGGAQILIDAETGQATTDVSKFKGDVDGIPDQVTSVVKVRVDSSAWDNYIPNFKTGVITVNPRIGREWQ